MRIIKKLATVAMAAVLTTSMMFTTSVQASLTKIKGVEVDNTMITVGLLGDSSYVWAYTAYTSSSGTMSTSITGYKYHTGNPLYTTLETRKSGTKAAPGDAQARVTASAPFCIYYAISTHSYGLLIDGVQYEGTVQMKEHINVD